MTRILLKLVLVVFASIVNSAFAQNQNIPNSTQNFSNPSQNGAPLFRPPGSPDPSTENGRPELEQREQGAEKAKAKKLPSAQPGNGLSGKSGTKLSLQESLRRGLDFGIEITQAHSLLRKAQAEYRVSDSFLFPTVNLIGQAGAQKASAANFGGFTGLTGESELYQAFLAVRQPLYQGGLVTAGLSASRVQIESAKQRLFDTKQKYAFSVIETYLKASKAQLLLELSRDNRSVLKSYFQVTSRYASIGRSKNIDRLTAEASYNLSEAEVLNAESELERSLQDLQQVTGFEVPMDTKLETETPLQPVETGSLNQLYQRAIENNPELRALEMDVDRQMYLNDVQLSEFFPRLSLDGTYGYTSPDRPNWIKDTSQTWTVFLNLTIPVFVGFRSLAERASNREDVFIAERQLAAKRIEIQRSLAKSMVTITREFSRLKLTQNSAAGARRAMDVALRDYRSGLLSSLDVLNIQRTRFDADRQYVEAQFSYQLQVLQLRRDLGTDLEKTYAALR